MTATDLRLLPAPDRHGNYYFGGFGGMADAAVLPLLSRPEWRGKYMATTPRGPVARDGSIVVFDTPQVALNAIRETIGG